MTLPACYMQVSFASPKAVSTSGERAQRPRAQTVRADNILRRHDVNAGLHRAMLPW